MIATPLTSARRGLSLSIEVEANPDAGLQTTNYIQCELIRSINRTHLVHPLDTIGSDISDQVATVMKPLLNN